MAGWTASLPSEEKDACLIRLLHGEGARVGGELLARFRRSRKPDDEKVGQQRRTAGSLRAAHETFAERRQQERTERAAREKERQEQKQAAARAKHLDSLQGKEAKLWNQVDQLVAAKQPRKYDQAVSLLRDLHDLWQRGAGGNFEKSLHDLMLRHSAKSSFKQRMRKAGFEV
jgi:hypothetical protein